MKISKRSLILLIIIIIVSPLLGNTTLFNIESLDKVNKFFLFLLPCLYFISFIWDMYKIKKFKIKIDFLTILIFLLIFALTISLMLGISFDFNSLTNFICFTYIALFIYTVHVYEFTKEDLINLFKALVLGFLIVSVIGIIQYIFNINLINRGVFKYPGSLGRITSTMSNATILDKYLSLNLLIIIYVIYKLAKFNWKLVLCFFLGVIALSFTYSRSGTICFYFIAFTFTLLFIYKKQWLNLLVIITSLVVLYLIPGQKYLFSSTVNYVNETINEIWEKLNIEFLSPINNGIANLFILDDIQENDDSLSSRDYYMMVAKKVIKEYPMIGIGIGNYNYLYKNQNVNDYLQNDLNLTIEYMYPHNLYYHFGAETGLIGLGLLFSVLGLVLFKAIKNNNLVIASLFFILFCLSSATESLFYMKDIAFWIIIIYALFMKKSYVSKS